MSNSLHDSHFSYGPAAVVAGHVLVAVYLLVAVVSSLRQAYRGLGSSVKKNSLLPLFAALALVSLGRAVYGAVDYGVLSYKVWASSRDVELPVRFYGAGGISGHEATPVYPLHWLNQTPFYLDAVQILTERPRRFWWGQQLDLGLISWTMFLAIEGRRRNMPLLWSYQLLAHLVSLALAQNLFFVAMLLTPLPLPARSGKSIVSRAVRRLFPRKPANWVPNTWVFGVPLIFSYLSAFWIPTRFGETDLKNWVLALRALTAFSLLARDVVPMSWGTRYRDIGSVYPRYMKMLRYMSLATFLIHARTSLAGLFFVDPEPHNHRHDEFLKYDVEQLAAWEQTTSAFGRLLESTADHPVVGLAGADVILASVSIGFWVAARAMDVLDILACTTPGFSAQREEEQPRTPTEKISMTWWEADALMSGANGSGLDSPARQAGRRLRSRKAKRNSPAPSVVEATDEAPPSEARDWESAAVVWGLTALGGLGLGSAGAYGSEIVAV